MKIGVISDTHGLLREEVTEYLSESDLIVHAGDIGRYEVLEELRKYSEVRAVRGNIDKEGLVSKIPEMEAFEVEGKFVYLLHNIDDLDIEPKGEFDIVIFGHSHIPLNETKDGVLYFNPGSAGPRRFKLPIAAGMIEIVDDQIKTEIREFN